MLEIVEQSSCPCGSGAVADRCCGQYIAGTVPAPSAEALMRSRYTGFVLKDEAYLLASWHGSTRPEKLGLDAQAEISWQGLEVLTASEEADTAIVEFVVRYTVQGREQRLHEKSRFVREDGRWYYVDGEIDPLAAPAVSAKVGRNEQCPCGSGRKYKKCCMNKG
ncbi:MAG: YchJ family metal-binding protein [Desulfobulbaceae bacterium]|nr:YchJ family metal-binding protein [Desulfobulbaceae bacterium]HIJ78594.1 hypothetical protein [Deltaproteobacteria bacterium]